MARHHGDVRDDFDFQGQFFIRGVIQAQLVQGDVALDAGNLGPIRPFPEVQDFKSVD